MSGPRLCSAAGDGALSGRDSIPPFSQTMPSTASGAPARAGSVSASAVGSTAGGGRAVGQPAAAIVLPRRPDRGDLLPGPRTSLARRRMFGHAG